MLNKNFVVCNIILLLVIFRLVSQPLIEQNSGVTVSLNSVSAFDFNNVWVCGDSGRVLKTSNGGVNWLIADNGFIPFNIKLNTIYAYNPSTIVTAGSNNNTAYVYFTSNSGNNWVQVFNQSNGFINSIFILNDTSGIMIGNPVGNRWSIWKTSNKGLSWDSTGLFLQRNNSESGYSNCFASTFNNYWFGTNNSRIYYSANYGLTWTAQSILPETEAASIWFGLSQGYFGGNSVYKSTNLGMLWQNIGSQGSGLITGLTGFPYWPNNLMCIRNGSNSLYFLQGGSWFNYPSPPGSYTHLTIERSNAWPIIGYAVRNNGGIAKISLIIPGIKYIEGTIPVEFSLSQNYPNPFNPTTKITFKLPEPGFAKLIIYDVLGKEIETLINTEMKPGTYEADWDASAYPSGVFYYRLIVETSQQDVFTATKKLILIK